MTPYMRLLLFTIKAVVLGDVAEIIVRILMYAKSQTGSRRGTVANCYSLHETKLIQTLIWFVFKMCIFAITEI